MMKVGERIGPLMRIVIILSLLWVLLAWFDSGLDNFEQLFAYTWPLLVGWSLFVLQRIYKKSRLPLYISIAYILMLIGKVVWDGGYMSFSSVIHFFPWKLFDKYTWDDRWQPLIIGLFIIWGLTWISLSIPASFKLSLKKMISNPSETKESSSKFIPNRNLVIVLVLFVSLGLQRTGKILYEEYQKKHVQETPMPLNAPAPIPVAAPVDPALANWYNFSPFTLLGPRSNSGISFMSPCVPESSKVAALEKASKRIKDYEHYTCHTKDFYVIYYWVSYKHGIKVDPNEHLTELSKQFNFKTKVVEPTTIEKTNGQLFNGTYETAKGSGIVKCVVVTNKSEAWSIILNYPRNDSAAESSAQKVINSIGFLKMPEPLTFK